MRKYSLRIRRGDNSNSKTEGLKPRDIAVSELLEPETSRVWESVLSTNLGWMEKVNIKIGGEG